MLLKFFLELQKILLNVVAEFEMFRKLIVFFYNSGKVVVLFSMCRYLFVICRKICRNVKRSWS